MEEKLILYRVKPLLARDGVVVKKVVLKPETADEVSKLSKETGISEWQLLRMLVEFSITKVQIV
jgi:hypothetical protein